MPAETDATTSTWLAPTLIAIGGMFITALGAVQRHVFGRIDKTDARVSAIEAELRADQRRLWEELNRHAGLAAEKREEIAVKLGNTATREDLNHLRQLIERLLQQRSVAP